MRTPGASIARSYYLPPATESEENLRFDCGLIDQQFLKTPFYGQSED